MAACYVATASLGWFLNGLGAVLPPLRNELGDYAGTYALLPGAVLLAWGVLEVTGRRARRVIDDGRGLVVGGVALAGTVLVMGLTRWPLVSAIGALLAAVAAAQLNRLVPGMLATARPADTERAMLRANAYGSTAVLVAPLSVGASIAVGLGWLPGFALPLAFGAIAVAVVVRRTRGTVRTSSIADVATSGGVPRRLPPVSTWWRQWVVLWLALVIEFCFAYFVVTFFNEELDLSEATAAVCGATWGAGMLVGRFVTSRWAPPRSVLPCAVTVLAGFVLFWGVPVPAIAVVGIGVAGLGASPLYPTLITALIARFPDAPHDGSTRGALAAGAALLVAPATMVALRAIADVRTAYVVVPVLLGALVALARPLRTSN